MDKGLKLINELETMLNGLEIRKIDNERELEKTKKDISYIENENRKLEDDLNSWKYSKTEIEALPNQRENQKRLLKKIILNGIIILICLVFSVFGVQLACGAKIVTALVSSLMTLMVGTGVISATKEFFTGIINKPTERDKEIEELDELITQNTLEIEDNKSRLSELNKKISTLKKNIYEIKQEIDKIILKVNDIKQIRTEVIEDYCKHNPQVEELINEAYDEKIENSKTIK